LTEDTTPDGYYKPSDSYTVALTADVTGKALGEASKMTTDENNSDTVVKAGEIDGTDKAQFDIYLKPVEIPALPVTGGAGIIAYVLFGLLIASAGVMMVVFARKGRGSASCAR
jgi:LPXTG-motif cell wall-anchored protein